jgi:hypothetical protein
VLPDSLVGESHRGGHICREWELRITRRCLQDDLGAAAESNFEDVAQEEIVRSFVKDRGERTHDTRQVSPLTSRREVWVLARGNDHRAGTWFDTDNRVVWLVAYRLHRSNTPDDFFPYCKALDANDDLYPTRDDFQRLIEDRNQRFAYAIRLEAPLILKAARDEGVEQKALLGGAHGAAIAVEAAAGLEETYIALRPETLSWNRLPVILAAFHADAWESAGRMPSRELDPGEIAFVHLHDQG